MKRDLVKALIRKLVAASPGRAIACILVFLGIVLSIAADAGYLVLINPLDAVLNEFTNDAIHLVNPALSTDLTANLWFSMESVVLLTMAIIWTLLFVAWFLLGIPWGLN